MLHVSIQPGWLPFIDERPVQCGGSMFLISKFMKLFAKLSSSLVVRRSSGRGEGGGGEKERGISEVTLNQYHNAPGPTKKT